MNIFEKIKFILRKPKVVIVTSDGKENAGKAISQVLRSHFKIGKEILIFETDLAELKKFQFLIKKSSLSILVASDVGEISPEIREMVKVLPNQGFLVFNFDDEKIRELKKEVISQTLSFGFQWGADIQASDVKINDGVNFKANYKGSIVPIWLASVPNISVEESKKPIYAALAATSVGIILNLNLVEISQALKEKA